MRLSDPRLWLALISLGLVLWLVYVDLGGFDVGQASPGPLSSVHQREAGLTGPLGCAACHGGRGTTMAEACTGCHAEIGQQLASGRGLHGSLGAQGERCALCHVEHHGDAMPLVSERAFALAGFPDRDAFDHPGLGFGLHGRHTQLACVDCHPHADSELLPVGERRFLGLTQTCVNCHEDPHRGRLGQSCEGCHPQDQPFERGAGFAHTPAFPLTGAHAGLACSACHPAGSEHDFERLAAPGPHPDARDCGACHASPHTEPFLAALARREGLRAGATCGGCHDAVRGGFEAERSRLTPELHALTGFALEPPHAGLACAGCHEIAGPALAHYYKFRSIFDFRVFAEEEPHRARGFAYALRFPGRSGEDCAACHADPHGGQFEAGTFLASQPTQNCLACHARTHFAPPDFGPMEHAATSFPLEGAHRRAACADCHRMPPEGQGPRIFHGTPSSCADCHADPHAGRLVGPSGLQDCAACHRSSTFADVDRAGFEHALRTGFALEGAHAAAACEVCHPRSEQPDELGRTFGRVEEHFAGPLDRCSTCHADVHDGHFLAPHLPRVVAGREDCARCHAPTAFADYDRAIFEHALWTGFELVGQHARAVCVACHVPAAEPDPRGRRFGRAPGRTCLDCHVDPHAGQFAARGPDGCASCHPPTGRDFRIREFDHSRTGFPLVGAHARAACRACHVPSPTATGELVVRYRPLGTRCQDCHDSRVRPEDLFDDDGGGRGRGRGRGRGGDDR